ncbi:MAG: 50S ribosomal protein L6 [Candidatus Peribacteria bacterium]|nr:MAG: 50S ribosomal protein L6 [Candidatus Peribacteria bacterium]
MSRIGKLPVELGDKVEANIQGNEITIKGPLGQLQYTFLDIVDVKIIEKTVVVTPKGEEAKAMWGTTRSLIQNMVDGVRDGYKKSLEINGVGYKFEVQGTKLILSIGYSHKVEVDVPQGLKVEMDEKAKNMIHITGVDKQALGAFTSKIRAMKKPEPYKGKGIKYVGEQIRRKAGKTGK